MAGVFVPRSANASVAVVPLARAGFLKDHVSTDYSTYMEGGDLGPYFRTWVTLLPRIGIHVFTT